MVKKLMKFFSLWPLAALHLAGALLGWLVYGCSAAYRKKIRNYSSVAFQGDEKARKAAVRGSIAQAGMALMELPFLWGRSTRKGALQVTDYENWDVAQEALASGKRAIFLTPHLDSFESAVQAFSARFPITVLYRPNRNQAVQEIIEEGRARNNIRLAPTTFSGVKTLFKTLKQGGAVGILPDQVPSSGEGVWAPMFGQQAYTMTLPGRLFHATGARIILALGLRKAFGKGFVLKLFPGPTNLSQDPVAAAKEINQAMEALIMLHPSQYYWGYERYKTPKGQ